MASDREGPRRYSDEEVRRLLDRASEMEREGGHPAARSAGPTLSELEEIAAEAGMDPALLREAARELDVGQESGSSPAPGDAPLPGLLGAPLVFELEEEIPGEVAPDGLEAMLPAIQRTAAEPGVPTLLRRSLTWHASGDREGRDLHASVTVGRGRTHIRIEEQYGDLARDVYGGLLGGVGCGVGFGVGMGVGFGALDSALFAFTFAAVLLVGTYLASRISFAGKVGDRTRSLRRLMDELTRLAEEAR